MSRKRASRQPEVATSVGASRTSTVIGFLDRYSRPTALLLVLIASLRIVSTYTVFSHTFDEPGHIAAGMEWLDRHTFTYEPKHPPLARVATALGPYLSGIRSQGVENGDPATLPKEGIAILYRDHHYDRTLALARLGVLPFFWIACLVLYWWGRRFFNPVVAVLAVGIFSFLPPVLAHAGVATTDMAVTAFLGATTVAAIVLLERPSLRSGALLGACAALALVAKLSAIAFLPACLGLAVLWYVVRERPAQIMRVVPALGVAVLAGALVIWATYRFSFGRVGGTGMMLPAPEFFAGIQAAMEHGQRGNRSYLFGERSFTGFWYFLPVALAVKSPIGFLILAGLGTFFVLRRKTPYRCAWLPVVFALGILLVGILSRINIGVRHILAIYLGLSMLAAVAGERLLSAAQTLKWTGGALALLLVWFAASSLMSHPDYIPYFNELAGSHPENIEVDSDLDWGQDIKRLAARLRQAGATQVTYNQFIIADLEREHGFPKIREMDLAHPSPGWNAADLTYLKLCRLGLFEKYPDLKLWPDYIPPTEMVGKSIRLWYVPPR